MHGMDATRQLRQEHAAIAAVLNSIRTLADAGPHGESEQFFDSIAGMLFYVDEFPERRHHPTESNLLFPMLMKAAPELTGVIRRLEMDHVAGEGRVRELQHLLLAWQFLGESRRDRFMLALDEYVRFYLKHMSVEETELLPLISAKLSHEQAAQLDAAFQRARDPLAGGEAEPVYAKLLESITRAARNPVGLGVD